MAVYTYLAYIIIPTEDFLMKKFLSIILIAVFVLSFASCGKKEDETSGVSNYAEKTSYDVKDSSGKVLGTLEYVAKGTDYATITKYTPKVYDLHSVTIPETLSDERIVTAIDSEAFKSCTYVTSVSIPETVREIGSWAFTLCTSLTEIKIPEAVESIGEGAFHGCDSLTKVIFEGDAPALKSIGNYAFNSCKALVDITLPEGVTSVGDGAFYECDALKTVSLPQSLKTLGKTVFAKCDAIEKITLGDNIESVGEYPFGTLLTDKPDVVIYTAGSTTDKTLNKTPDAE